ncbi:MAG: hypothetical protein J7K82_00275 [Thermoproteales archaeon]|nr:hypothetical protein [Thermoproteales archaeon]
MIKMWGKSLIIIILALGFASILVLTGLIFTIAAFTPGKTYRLFIGVPLLAAGLGIVIYALKPEPKILTISVKWDPSGKIITEELKCPYCNAPLPPPKPGADIIKCPYCGKTIKITEEPIW